MNKNNYLTVVHVKLNRPIDANVVRKAWPIG